MVAPRNTCHLDNLCGILLLWIGLTLLHISDDRITIAAKINSHRQLNVPIGQLGIMGIWTCGSKKLAQVASSKSNKLCLLSSPNINF